MEGRMQNVGNEAAGEQSRTAHEAGGFGVPQPVMGEMSAAFVPAPEEATSPGNEPDPAVQDGHAERLLAEMDALLEADAGASSHVPISEVVQDSETIVQLDDDLLAAHIFITTPIGGGKVATLDGVKAKLAEAGVVFGIDEAALEKAVTEVRGLSIPGMRWGPVLVAKGKPPIPGKDARIDYHPCLTATSGRPVVNPDGTVNLFDLNVVHNVAKGTVLAVETPQTPGTPGMTVTGGEIQPRPGRECWLKTGKGTELSEDKLTVTAAFDGHATLMQGEISVTNIFQVNKDVGVETGNIQFVGSVVIRGNVQPGFCVKAEGDVEVQGGVDGGTVEAAGNITVQYGIKGTAGRGKVVAGGAVKAKFIESADVRAGTNVWAADGILQSRVEAGATIEVLGRRGAIIGGRVSAQTSVAARILGSALGNATEISVGVPPAARTEMGENRKKQAELEEQLQRTNQAIQFLMEQERRGMLGPEKRATLTKLGPAQERIYGTIESLKQRARELDQMHKILQEAYADIRQSILSLRTATELNQGLLAAIRASASDFAEQNSIPVELVLPEESEVSFSAEAEVQLVRIVQEALANVRKHARATKVWIRLERQEGGTTLSIEDDGVGFDLSQLADRKRRSFGLQTMRERAESVGAQFEISAVPSEGTRIQVRFPHERHATEPDRITQNPAG